MSENNFWRILAKGAFIVLLGIAIVMMILTCIATGYFDEQDKSINRIIVIIMLGFMGVIAAILAQGNFDEEEDDEDPGEKENLPEKKPEIKKVA